MDCLNYKNTLVCCKINKLHKIKRVIEDEDCKYSLRLYELGFLPGEEVLLKQKSFKQKTFLVQVRGVSYVLQENLANLVLLEGL